MGNMTFIKMGSISTEFFKLSYKIVSVITSQGFSTFKFLLYGNTYKDVLNFLALSIDVSSAVFISQVLHNFALHRAGNVFFVSCKCLRFLQYCLLFYWLHLFFQAVIFKTDEAFILSQEAF